MNNQFSSTGGWILPKPNVTIKSNGVYIPYVPLAVSGPITATEHFNLYNGDKNIIVFNKDINISPDVEIVFKKLQYMTNQKLHKNLFITSEIFKFSSFLGNLDIYFGNDYIFNRIWGESGNTHEIHFHHSIPYIRIMYTQITTEDKFNAKCYKIIYDCNNDKLIFSGKQFNKINAMFKEDVLEECTFIYDKKSWITRKEYEEIFSKIKDDIKTFQKFILVL